jgi:NADH dehydrogenase (ubiquinone) 1 alpha subcomplex subunit 8
LAEAETICGAKTIETTTMASSTVAADSTALMCGATIYGTECSGVNKDFLICKSNDGNPRACSLQGEKVTACVLKTLRVLETHCGASYNEYKNAMDKNWHELQLCRKEQFAMEACYREWKTNKNNNTQPSSA